MTTAERIAQLADKLESETRKDTVAEMIAELRDFSKTVPSDQTDGVLAAIGFLKENFS